MASRLQWIPDSLYNYSVSTVVHNFSLFLKELRTFPGRIVFDVYYKLYTKGFVLLLENELENIDQFEKLLKVYDKRVYLHNCFQTLMDNGYDTATKLAEKFKQKCYSVLDSSEKQYTIRLGFMLGNFLIEAGWFAQSETVYLSCFLLCSVNNKQDSAEYLSDILECQTKLLHTWNMCCKFEEGQTCIKDIESTVEKIRSMKYNFNLSSVYSEFSSFHFVQGNYKEAYSWSIEAIKQLNSNLSCIDVINVLRVASKACVVKKYFKQAEILIKYAVHMAKERFEHHRSLILADALLDYGYYLLHIDSVGHSVRVYQKALDLRNSIIGGTNNLLLATAHEDFAYASYVYEYSSGRFKDAKAHIERSLRIKEALLPEDHFLLNSVKRVNALILEELAIDSHDKLIQDLFFNIAEELHTSSLQITIRCVGENNVLTGKHYGNLGRLYQSMKKFEEAERMLLTAIKIKQSILGPHDYEVAISKGHLASLYNYDMEMFKQARDLYLSSIEIGVAQFGKSYSGLEFDYKGLLRIYCLLGDAKASVELQQELHQWKRLREETNDKANSTSPLEFQLKPLEIPQDLQRLLFHTQ